MQVRHVCSRVPPRLANLTLCYNRFTLSRIATAYFLLALVHCIAQIVLQIRAFEIEHNQSAFLHNIKHVGDVKNRFAILDSQGDILICHAIPGYTSDPNPCEKFNASGLASTSPDVSLNTCSQVLAWPAQIIHQAIRESITMMVFQLWLVGISVAAIISESIPHVVAGLVTQLLSTAWSLFHIACTVRLHRRFDALVTNLACNNVDPLPNYWASKLDNEIPIVALNAASLLMCFCLSLKLCKQFGFQSFTRVGGSKRIHHLYLLMLILHVCLQLTTFFLIASVVLWIEQLFDGPIASVPNKQTILLSLFIVTALFIPPWRYLGWTAVRHERRGMMVVFLFTSIFLIVSEMGMFVSSIYRLTFSTWNFFGSITVVAYILLNLSFFMALVCRYFFGRGLAHFLHVQEALDECDFTPVYIERRSGTFDSAKEPEGEALPWDVEGKGEVKKLRLQPDQNLEGLSSTQMCTPRTASFNYPASQRSFRVSFSPATDSHDPQVILDATTIINNKTTATSSTATDELGIAPSDHLSQKSSVSSKLTLPESGGDSILPADNTANPIHRGTDFPSSPASGQSLVDLPSNTNYDVRLPI